MCMYIVDIYSNHLMIPAAKVFIDDKIVNYCINTRASFLFKSVPW